jgi:hypothetical protein
MVDYDESLEFDFMVAIEGFLVPIAHIKAIGWVEEIVSEGDFEPEDMDNQYFFRVYLDQPISMRDDPATRDLAAFFPTEHEALQARMDLAQRVDDYYKNVIQGGLFPGSIQ